MQMPPLRADATDEERTAYLTALHNCMDRGFDATKRRQQWSLAGIAAIITLLVTLTASVGKAAWAGIDWAHKVDTKLTVMQATLDQHTTGMAKMAMSQRQVKCILMGRGGQLDQAEINDICGVPTPPTD